MRTRAKNESRGRLHRESGFTLLEMIVSIAIFTIVTGAIYGLLHVGSIDSNAAKAKAEVIQNVRIAYQTILRDCLNAGVSYPTEGATVPNLRLSNTASGNEGMFPGIDDEGDSNIDRLTPVTGMNDYNLVNGVATDEVTFCYPDRNFNSDGSSIPLLGSIPVTPNWSLFTTSSTDYAKCSVGDLFLITGTSGQSVGWLTAKPGSNELRFGSTDPININQPSNTYGATRSIGQPLSMQKIILVTYYVGPDGSAAQGTLLRYEWGAPPNRLGTGASATTTTGLNMPVAYFVEDLQIQYILEDGTTVDYPSPRFNTGTTADQDGDPATPPTTVYVDQRQEIRQLRMTITARTSEVDPRSRQYTRMTVPANFAVRNLGYAEK